MQFFQKLCVVVTLTLCSYGVTHAMHHHRPFERSKIKLGVDLKHSRALPTTRISKRKQRALLLRFQVEVAKQGRGASSVLTQAVACCLEKYLADRHSPVPTVCDAQSSMVSQLGPVEGSSIAVPSAPVMPPPASVSVTTEPETNYIGQLFCQIYESAKKEDIPNLRSLFAQFAIIIDEEKKGKTESEQQDLETLKQDLAAIVEALTTPEPTPQPSRLHRIMSWCWAHPRTTLGIGILIGIAGWAIFAPASLIATASSGWQLMTNLGYIITHAQEIAMHTRDIQVIKNILCSVVRPSLRALRQKVAALELVVGVHTGQISAILASLDGINLALGALDGRVDVVEHDVVTIFQRLNATQIEINALPGEILDRIAGQTTFFNLDRSFTSLLGTAASHIPGLG